MPDDHLLDANAANLERVRMAADALVRVLRPDLRVQRAYESWRHAHEFPPVGVYVDKATMLHLILRDKERDLAALDQLVHDDLGLPYRWLPQQLLVAFVGTAQGEHGGDPRGHASLVPGPVDWPAGRPRKDDEPHIARDVEWFYRAEIKYPRDSIRRLAREYQATLGEVRAADARPTVRAGIQRAKQLLAALP